jgi:glycosyltransferase involved in cell wall biosynthesis
VRRVLLWSKDPVGRAMAGPGIRYLNFAHALAEDHEVTLVSPEPFVTDAFESRVPADIARLSPRALSASFDVVVAEGLPLTIALRASRAGVRLVLDLYTPSLVEGLAHLSAQPDAPRANQLRYDEVRAFQQAGLEIGDAFLCASERQRDLWLGALAAMGRLSVEGWELDPSFRDLVTVVPFGLDGELPMPGKPALRGVVPGIGKDDFVLLWNGGIWNWFDPLTVIDAVARLVEEGRREFKLVFLGTQHPNPVVSGMGMAERAVAHATSLGLVGKSVFFNDGWVPYAERHRFLLDSDIGVSAHFDNLETRFAFRTRLLDCFWAALPVVCTGGDALGDLVRERRAGLVVPELDVLAWRDAVLMLADNPLERSRLRAQMLELREWFTWDRVCVPLARLIADDAGHRLTDVRYRTLVFRSVNARIRASVAHRGVWGTVRAGYARGRRQHS